MPNIIGKIDTPAKLGFAYGNLEGGGLVSFLNNLVSLIITLAGLFTLINIILSGYYYLFSNGDPQKISKAHAKIIPSLVGLGIVAAAFVIAGIVGQLLFGNINALLNPAFLRL